ncbi:hypothetical protein ACFFW8_18925 [Erwinia tracheiphila]
MSDTPHKPLTALFQRVETLMLRDRQRLLKRLHGAKKVKNPHAQEAIASELNREIDLAEQRVNQRRAAIPGIRYPDNLPVSQKKQEIADAIQAHQVVIVAGETGSGKTTQLPKICMELGRG